MTEVLLVCLGAAVGAPARYVVDRAVQARHDSLLPWGTLTVNVTGSLLLGLLVGLGPVLPEGVLTALGAGLCGALTTYSTMSYETLRLVEDGARLYALANVGLNLVLGLAAAAGGYALGTLA